MDSNTNCYDVKTMKISRGGYLLISLAKLFPVLIKIFKKLLLRILQTQFENLQLAIIEQVPRLLEIINLSFENQKYYSSAFLECAHIYVVDIQTSTNINKVLPLSQMIKFYWQQIKNWIENLLPSLFVLNRTRIDKNPLGKNIFFMKEE